MQILKSKRSMLILVTLASIIAIGVTTALAQEMVKVNFKKFIVITKYESTEVGDTEGHFLNQYEAKDISSDGRFITYKGGQGDYIKGTGHQKGYNKVIDREGGTYFSKFEGMRSESVV